ncbi:MAG: GDSL-type esterase/lipase family protein [Bacteroidales bacterium]|nr:GDSL-type esterase/lipase family protein [Bacteroidales bacterium]
MSKIIKYFSFFTLLSLLQISCSGQVQDKKQKSIPEIEYSEYKSTQISPVDNRNIKRISKFIDTALLKRYYSQIEFFITEDSSHPLRQTDIVFSGSSSIRKWKTLQEDMKGLKVINRGFGGSTVPEAIYYADILFFKHHPKKIVFYSGDNDIAFQRWDINRVFESYKYFCNVIHSQLPNTKIYIVSLKPSPARKKYWEKMKVLNDSLRIYIHNQNLCEYIDVSNNLIDSSGNIKEEYFAKDGVHLNKEGYKIWAEIIYDKIK